MNAKQVNTVLERVMLWVATALFSSVIDAGKNYAVIVNYGNTALCFFTGNLISNAKNLTVEDRAQNRMVVTWSPLSKKRDAKLAIQSRCADLLSSLVSYHQDRVVNNGGYASVNWVETKVALMMKELKDDGELLYQYIIDNGGFGAFRVHENAKSGRYQNMESIGMVQEVMAKQLDIGGIALDAFLDKKNSQWHGKTVSDMISSLPDATSDDPKWKPFQKGAGVAHGDVIDFTDL